MAKIQGYNQYVCDRCSKVEYATDTDPKIQQWKAIERIGSDGIKNERLLCMDCIREYRKISQKADEEFARFMVEGGKE